MLRACLVSDACSLVYVTCKDVAEARTLALTVIEEKLAACANLLSQATSIYRWEGRIESAEECVIVFKTRTALYGALEQRLRALHSYSNPCIVAYAIAQGSATYLDWIRKETLA